MDDNDNIVFRDVWAGRTNRQSPVYIQPGREDRARYDFIAAAVKRFNPKSVRVIEVGCNIGAFPSLLIKDGFVAPQSMVGIDIDPFCIEVARGYVPEATFEVAAIEYVREFVTGQFDVILAPEVLEHVGDLRRAMSALASIASPNAVIVIITPDANASDWARKYSIGHPEHHRLLLTETILRDELALAGFETETVERLPMREDGYSALMVYGIYKATDSQKG